MYKLIWPKVNRFQLFEEAAEFFGVDARRIGLAWEKYGSIYKKYDHDKLGELKTLNTDETFVIYLILELSGLVYSSFFN